jgi:hypothetical protein
MYRKNEQPGVTSVFTHKLAVLSLRTTEYVQWKLPVYKESVPSNSPTWNEHGFNELRSACSSLKFITLLVAERRAVPELRF